MALNNLGLGIVFTASDLASGVIKKVAGNFLGLEDSASKAVEGLAKKVGVEATAMNAALAGVSNGLAVAALGAAGLSTAFALAKGAGQFEQGLAAVGAVSRATTEEMAQLENAALQAGIATQFSPEQAVEGLNSLAAAGQNAQQATATLIPVLDLAAGSMGQLGVAGAAEAVVGTLNAYGKSASEAGSVTDRLLRITQLSNFQTRDFSAGLAKAAAAGATFNQTLDDTLIGMGLLRNRNIDASSASTALREATRRLGSDQRAQRQVTELGVDVFDKQTGRMRSLLDIMGDFKNATANLSTEERNRRVAQAFGARGLLAFQAVASATFSTMRDGQRVTLRGAEAIEAMRAEMNNAEGTAANFRDALADTFKGQLTLLEGSVKTFAINIGKPFAKVLKPVVMFVVDSLNLLISIVSSLPDSVKKGLAGFFVAGSISLLIGGITAALMALLPVIKIVGGAILAALGAALLPALKVVAVVALVIGAVWALKKAWDANFGGIQDAVLPVLEKISLAFRALFGILGKGEISGALAEDLAKAENKGILGFVQGVSRAFARIKAFFVGFGTAFVKAAKNLSGSFMPVFASLRVAFEQLWEAGMTLFTALGEALGFETAGSEGVDSIKMIGEVLGWVIAGPLQLFIQALAKVIKVAADIAVVFGSVINFIAKAFRGLAGIVGGIFSVIIAAITGSMNGVFRGIAQVVNGAVRLVNQLIESAAKAIAIVSSDKAKKLRDLKLNEVSGSQVAFAVGASDARVQSLARGETPGVSSADPAPAFRPPASAAGAGGGTSPASPGSGSAPATTPQGQPPAQGGSSLSNQDVALIVAAIERSRSGPVNVTVSSRLEVEGETVASAVEQAQDEEAAKTGRFQPNIGRR